MAVVLAIYNVIIKNLSFWNKTFRPAQGPPNCVWPMEKLFNLSEPKFSVNFHKD